MWSWAVKVGKTAASHLDGLLVASENAHGSIFISIFARIPDAINLSNLFMLSQGLYKCKDTCLD